MPKLDRRLLSTLPSSVDVPQYAVSDIKVGIAHFGVGGFHRAHQAIYMHDLFDKGLDKEWGILGVGIIDNDAKMRDSLKSQDYLYSVLERSATTEKLRIVGSIIDFVLAADGKEKLFDRLTDPNIRIASLTITEKGYYFDPATGNLDMKNTNVAHDIKSPHDPVTTIGYIVEALARRRKKGVKPFTVMSCDNLPSNGDVVRRLTLQYVEAAQPDLKSFIEKEVCFPNTMVDRITPVTTAQNVELLRDKYNVEDQWPIFPEDFRQWVIEDKFSDGRPQWEKVGADIVNNVHDYEIMKIRLLNGSHSALAYLSYLLGHRDVDKAMADPLIKAFLKYYMDEVGKTLKPIAGVDFDKYKKSLIARFSNPAIKDQVQRLAMDGSQKLPNAIIAPLREAIAKGLSFDYIVMAIAGWIRYLSGKDEQGQAIDINDPMSAHLCDLASKAQKDVMAFVKAFPTVFPSDVSDSGQFQKKLKDSLESIYAVGVKKYLEDILLDAPGKVA